LIPKIFERKLVRQPGVDPALERADSRDPFRPKKQRHPGAGRFIGSRTVKDNIAVAGNFPVTFFKLFHSHAQGSRQRLGKRLDVERLAQIDDQHVISGA
jgi:hypothetical protein